MKFLVDVAVTDFNIFMCTKSIRSGVLIFVALIGLGIWQSASAQGKAPDIRQRLLSSNYDEAIRALREVVATRSAKLICVGLSSRHWLIRWQAAKEMRDMAVSDSVPCLIKALENNQGFVGGGSEEHSSQDDINRDLVYSLARVTGFRMSEKERYSAKEIENLISESKRWRKRKY